MRKVIGRLRAALVLSVALAAVMVPRAARAELSLGVANDFIHAARANAVVLRYDWRTYNVGGGAMAWHGSDGDNGAITLDYNLLGFFHLPVDFDFGAAYLAKSTRLNGSNLNFELTGAVNVWHVRVFFSHFSNAGIKPPNPGWNFLGIAWRF